MTLRESIEIAESLKEIADFAKNNEHWHNLLKFFDLLADSFSEQVVNETNNTRQADIGRGKVMLLRTLPNLIDEHITTALAEGEHAEKENL